MNSQLRMDLSIVNEVELIYRTRYAGERPSVSNSSTADALIRPYMEPILETYEVFYVLILDRGNRAKSIYKASQGGLHGTVADPKLIFAAALKCLASGIVLCHNHPSGQLRPSEEDIRLTRKLCQGGQLLDISVQDHLIMTRNGYYSFADNGMMGA